MRVLEEIAPVVLLSCGIVFVAVYSALARWWSSSEGRSLAGIGAAMSVMGAHGMMWPAREVPAMLAFAQWWSALILLNLSVIAWNAQVHERWR